MGKKLIQAFEIAKQEKGIQAQFRLAIRCGMSLVKAEEVPDDETYVANMKLALEQIIGKKVEL